jgi:YidC/Oxa1 family membrane protein insertase
MEQRNMILAFALSMVVMLGWGVLFPQQEVQKPQQPQTEAAADLTPASDIRPPDYAASATVPSAASVQTQALPAEAIAAASASFTLGNDLIELQLNDKGWFTHADLKTYKETMEANSEPVAVLNMGDGHSVYVNSGVMGAEQTSPFKLVKQGQNSLHLRSELEGGRVWDRTISMKQGSYVVDVKDTIIEGGGLKLYRQVVESHPDKSLNTFYEHMGPTALLNGTLVEPDYDDLDEKGAERAASMGGWTAIMNRYFIAAIIANPEQDYPYYFKGDGRSYQAGLIDDGTLQGKDAVFHISYYFGPKSIPILKTVNAELERSVDFGWFAPISKPMHSFLGWLYNYLGNFGFCIIVLVICIKIIFFYPTQKSYQSMAGMRKLQPEMNRLKELYGDDKQKMGQEVMELYKTHKVNPLGGCLPIVIQIPVFFALYKVLLMSIEMRQAPFIGWIEDMSVQDPYFVLPLVMGASMFIQQRLNPQPADPMQAKVMQFLPVIFTALFLFFPAGLVLYWVVNNILSIVQQRWVMKRMNVD